MDIRRRTCLIVRRDGRFLVGVALLTNELKWSESPYDAWRTRRRIDAENVARRVGGSLCLFNPVAGQLRALKENHNGTNAEVVKWK